MEEEKKETLNFDFYEYQSPYGDGFLGFGEQVNKNKGFISYGEANCYPQDLIKIKNMSDTHSAVIELMADLVVGDGVKIQNANEVPLDQLQKAHKLIKNINSEQSMDEVLKSLAYDLIVFNGMSYQISKATKAKKMIGGIYHQPLQNIRFKALNESQKRPSHVFLSDEWEQKRMNIDTDKLDNLKLWDFNDKKENKGTSGLRYYKGHSMDSKFYPTPKYSALLETIKSEHLVNEIITSLLENSAMPSMIVEFMAGDSMDKKTKKALLRQLGDRIQGKDGAGGVFALFHKNKEHQIKVTVVDRSAGNEYFHKQKQLTVSQILTGWRFTNGSLLGIESAGKLGGGSGLEKLMSYQQYMKSVIKPLQNTLMNEMEKVLAYNNIDVKLEICQLDLIEFNLSESGLLQVLTKDELRERLGYEPLAEDEKPLSDEFSSEEKLSETIQEILKNNQNKNNN